MRLASLVLREETVGEKHHGQSGDKGGLRKFEFESASQRARRVKCSVHSTSRAWIEEERIEEVDRRARRTSREIHFDGNCMFGVIANLLPPRDRGSSGSRISVFDTRFAY